MKRVSSSICAVRVARAGAISTDGDLPRVVPLSSGVVVYAYKDGICLLDCEGWSPGASIEIPWPIGGAQDPKKLLAFERAYTDIEERIRMRVRALNCFLACVNSAASQVQAHSIPTRDEVTLDSYHALQWPRGNLATLTSAHVEHGLKNEEAMRGEQPKTFEIGVEALLRACSLLDDVLANVQLTQMVELVYKARDAYRRADFPQGSIHAWAVCETVLHLLWKRHLDGLSPASNGANIRISSDRKKGLVGRAFNAFIVTEILELLGLINLDLYVRANAARDARNAWMHRLQSPNDEDTTEAIRLAQDMIEIAFGLRLDVNLMRSNMV